MQIVNDDPPARTEFRQSISRNFLRIIQLKNFWSKYNSHFCLDCSQSLRLAIIHSFDLPQPHTFPFACGIPNGHWYTRPSREARALLYPDTASGEDLSLFIRSRHLSTSGVSWDGKATDMLPRHQAADRRADGLGWISTDTTDSMMPAIQKFPMFHIFLTHSKNCCYY